MERTLSPDERIRRAEEIYYRKKIQAGNKDVARVNVNDKPNYNLLKKMFLQIAICIFLYCILYLLQTTEYVFSGDVLNRTKEILSHDTDFKSIYLQIVNKINGFIPKQEIEVESSNQEETPADNTEQNSHNVQEEIIPTEQEDAQGGADTTEPEEINDLSQMELDARHICAEYSLILPLRGTISSRFGNRNPTTPTVPKYHTGIDIAVNEGTVFIASMEGTVSLVSSVRRLPVIMLK